MIEMKYAYRVLKNTREVGVRGGLMGALLCFALCWHEHVHDRSKWNTVHFCCHLTSLWWNLGKVFAIYCMYLEGQTARCRKHLNPQMSSVVVMQLPSELWPHTYPNAIFLNRLMRPYNVLSGSMRRKAVTLINLLSQAKILPRDEDWIVLTRAVVMHKACGFALWSGEIRVKSQKPQGKTQI